MFVLKCLIDSWKSFQTVVVTANVEKFYYFVLYNVSSCFSDDEDEKCFVLMNEALCTNSRN